MKQFYSTHDLQSMLEYLEDAVANDELGVAESIMYSLKRLSVKAQEGKVDMEACTLTHMMDEIIRYRGILDDLDEENDPVDLELENNKLERENEMLKSEVSRLKRALQNGFQDVTDLRIKLAGSTAYANRLDNALNRANQGLEYLLNG